MTTILYLEGEPEDFDDTLRHYIASAWDPAKAKDRTPTFQSGHGYDTKVPAVDPLSSKEWQALTGQDLIQFREDGDDVTGLDNFRTQHMTNVNIGVYAESPALRRLFCQELNRILLARVPNKGTRIIKAAKAADGTSQNSAIAYFETLQVSFTDLPAYADVGTTWSSHGTLGCLWYEVQ